MPTKTTDQMVRDTRPATAMRVRRARERRFARFLAEIDDAAYDVRRDEDGRLVAVRLTANGPHLP
jgi:hypothetical protein